MKKIILALGILSAVYAPSAVFAETMVDALTDAYKQNPTLLAKRASLRATDEGVAVARSGYRPTLSLDGSVGATSLDAKSNAGKNNESLTPSSAEISVVQPIFRGGRTIAATSRAEYNVQAEQAQLWDVEQSTLLAAVSAYMDVLRDRAVVELNQNNETVLQRQLKATQDRFSVGELTRTDVAQAESRAERAKAGVITAQGQLATSETNFQKIVGRRPGSDLIAPDVVTDLPANRDQTIEMALQQSPLIKSAEFLEKASKEQISEISGEELPQIDLRGTAASDRDRSQDGDKVDSLSVLAQVSFPFYQGGAVMARSRAASEINNQRRMELMAAQRDVSEQAGRSWDDLATARANIDAYNSAIKAAEIALDGVKQEQEVGSRTVLDVLDAEQELLDSKVSLVRARRDEIVASYTVLSAIGKLTASELKLPVEIYDPNQHYKNSRNKWFGY